MNGTILAFPRGRNAISAGYRFSGSIVRASIGVAAFAFGGASSDGETVYETALRDVLEGPGPLQKEQVGKERSTMEI